MISMWAGNYGTKDQKTLVRFSYDKKQGFRVEQEFEGLLNPSFLILHPALPVLYTVEECAEGAVCAWRMEGEKLQPWGRLETLGSDPCHLAMSPDAQWLYAANYSSGSVAGFRLDGQGRLIERTDLRQHTGSGPNPTRQEGPHAHCVLPLHDLIYVCDLGLDRIRVYRNENGTLREVGDILCPQGSGPRHLAVNPDHPEQLYCVTELSGEVLRIVMDADGMGEVVQSRSTLPASFHGSTTAAAIHFTPDHRWLLASQRGADVIAAMRIQEDGSLSEAVFSACPREPRDFLLWENMAFIGSQKDGYVEAYRLDEGHLTSAGQKLEMVSPVCLQSAYQ